MQTALEVLTGRGESASDHVGDQCAAQLPEIVRQTARYCARRGGLKEIGLRRAWRLRE